MTALSKKLNNVDGKISNLTKASDELSRTIQQTESHLKQVRPTGPVEQELWLYSSIPISVVGELSRDAQCD